MDGTAMENAEAGRVDVLVRELARRLLHNFNAMVVKKGRALSPFGAALLWMAALVCYPLLVVVLAAIVVLTVAVAVPVAVLAGRRRRGR